MAEYITASWITKIVAENSTARWIINSVAEYATASRITKTVAEYATVRHCQDCGLIRNCQADYQDHG